ncbi:hypothetical protein [Paenibacillus sp. BAC0078]
MFVIEVREERRSWISGIFEDEVEADVYMRQIPSELSSIQRKVPLHEIQYPFYMIEN